MSLQLVGVPDGDLDIETLYSKYCIFGDGTPCPTWIPTLPKHLGLAAGRTMALVIEEFIYYAVNCEQTSLGDYFYLGG